MSGGATGGLVGLFPAAGRASRLGEPGVSKEILPIGTRRGPDGRPRPVLVCENLLAAFRAAGCVEVLVLRRQEKRDLEAALGDGSRFGLAIEHLVVPPTASVPATLDQAYARVRDREVALGFPDVLAHPVAGLADAVARRRASGADVVLALYPTDRPQKCDMVALGEDGLVQGIEIKPVRSSLELTWLHATWGPRFSSFLHEALPHPPALAGRELTVSDVLLRAIDRGLRVEGVAHPAGSHLDVGTPDDLARARGRFGALPNGA